VVLCCAPQAMTAVGLDFVQVMDDLGVVGTADTLALARGFVDWGVNGCPARPASLALGAVLFSVRFSVLENAHSAVHDAFATAQIIVRRPFFGAPYFYPWLFYPLATLALILWLTSYPCLSAQTSCSRRTWWTARPASAGSSPCGRWCSGSAAGARSGRCCCGAGK
jgi:hypothetical protein